MIRGIKSIYIARHWICVGEGSGLLAASRLQRSKGLLGLRWVSRAVAPMALGNVGSCN